MTKINLKQAITGPRKPFRLILFTQNQHLEIYELYFKKTFIRNILYFK